MFSSHRTLEDEVLVGICCGGAINHHIQNDLQQLKISHCYLKTFGGELATCLHVIQKILVRIQFVKILKAISVQYMISIILKSPMLRIYQMGYSFIYIYIFPRPDGIYQYIKCDPFHIPSGL